MIIELCSAGFVLYGLYRWLIHLQNKERTILATAEHPVFGTVRRYRHHWEAEVNLTEGEPKIGIWGESVGPVDIQVSTLAAIRERYQELLVQTIQSADAFSRELGITLSPHDLQLESIHLSAEALGFFTLSFAVPAHVKKLPWGLSANFANFAVDDISDNH